MEPVTLALLCTAVVVVLTYVVHRYAFEPFNFWKNLGVPQVKMQYPLIGDVLLELTESPPEHVLKSYNEFPNERFYGTYEVHTPKLVVRDPELVEAVLIRDFAQLSDRGSDDNPEEAKAKHLFTLKEEPWKHMRNKLAPTFSSGKLKGMHQQLIDCGEMLAKYVAMLENGPFEVRDVISRYTTDVIASCAFGLTTDSINEPDSTLRMIGLAILRPSWKVKIEVTLRSHLPKWLLGLVRGEIRFPTLQKRKDAKDIFATLLDSTLEYRQKNSFSRPDFLHLMNQIRITDQEAVSKGDLDPKSPYVFDHNSLVSNAFVFFLAGFETSSTISNTMYEFALNEDVQDKAYKEVARVLEKHGGSPSYDATQEMNYLEKCISETLRKYPPVPMQMRRVSGEYRVPGTDLVLPHGVKIAIPVYGLQHDPQHYPEPEKYLPERFDVERDLIRKGTYLPFGAGPRICIGARFAKLEAKVCLSMLLSKYKFVKCEKTQVPMKFDKKSFMLSPEGGIWLSFQRRDAH